MAGTRVVPSNTVLDRGPGPPQEGEIWRSEPSVRSNAAYHQITLALSDLISGETETTIYHNI